MISSNTAEGLVVAIGLFSISAQMYTGWVGCQTAGDWAISQRNGQPTSINKIVPAICMFTPGVGFIAGVGTKYVIDIPNPEGRDVPTPYQIKHGI